CAGAGDAGDPGGHGTTTERPPPHHHFAGNGDWSSVELVWTLSLLSRRRGEWSQYRAGGDRILSVGLLVRAGLGGGHRADPAAAPFSVSGARPVSGAVVR